MIRTSAGGAVAVNTLGLPIVLGGGFALTYTIHSGGRKYAVRCFYRKTESLEERYRNISAALCHLPDGPFVQFEFQPQGVLVGGQRFPIVKMQWAEGPTLGMYLEEIHSDRDALEALSRDLDGLQEYLLRQGIAHGDIQNGNVIRGRQGITLIDYDGMYVPGMAEGSGTELGHKHWQHPGRSHAAFGPKIDRFSFAMLKVTLAALARNATLFGRYNNGENLLFTANDYADPGNSRLFAELRGIPEVTRQVQIFAEVCEAPISHVPDPREFARLASSRAVPVDSRSPRGKATGGPAPYIAALPVVPAGDYAIALRHVGDRVELIGKVVECYHGRDKNQDGYLFLNFAPYGTPRFVRAIIWSSGLRAFRSPPDKSWQGKWVSVTGLLDPPYDGRQSTTIGLTLFGPSQLRQISEGEAGYRLRSAVAGPPRREEQDEDQPAASRSNEQVLARILQLSRQSGNSPRSGSPSPPVAPGTPALAPPRPLPGMQQTRSDYSGKLVGRNQLQQSEKPPGRLGLPDEFGRCELTGRRLLLDELGRCVLSNKVVDLDLLVRSAHSGGLALPAEMVTCEETGARLLPSEVGRCSVTGKKVDARLLGTSEWSGRVALLRLMQRCALTQNLVLLTELEQCQLTGKRVIPSELETCAATGVRGLKQRMVACEQTGQWILPSEAARSDCSGKTVKRSLLQRSEKPPHRMGLAEEFGVCEVTGKRLLLDELGRSAVSGRQVDRSLLRSSARSGRLALADEMVVCQESGVEVLPEETAQCGVTGQTVDAGLLARSEVSGAFALSRLMERCAATGKLCLPSELETCEVTRSRVLPRELDTCSVTGKRVLKSRLVLCGKTRRPVLDTESGRSAVSGLVVRRDLLFSSEKSPYRLGLAEETAVCQVTGRRLLLDELGVSAVSGKRVDRGLLISSACSGAVALAAELVTCEESGARLLPAEAGRCSMTGKLVDARLLSTSEHSGRVALARLTRRCAVTGKLALTEELERCDLTGDWVLPSELKTCAMTGKRSIPGSMLCSDVSGKYVVPQKAVRSAVSGKVGLPEEAVRCAWLEQPVLRSEAKGCTLTRKVVASSLLNDGGELAALRELLDGRARDAIRADRVIPRIRRLGGPFFRGLKHVWVVWSPTGGKLAACGEIHSWLGMKVRYAGFLLKVQGKGFEITGQGVVGYRGREGWILEDEVEFP